MNVFGILGVVDVKNLDIGEFGRPMKFIEIKPEFKDLLQHTQGVNNVEKDKPHNSEGEYDKYLNINPEKFLKNIEKKSHTQVKNSMENPKPQKNIPVCDKKIDFSELDKETIKNES